MPQAQAARPHGRLEALDGLRALAIVIVLLGHGSWTDNSPQILRPLRHLGILGVELFFVISGFIITHLLLRERAATGSLNLPAFWRRRALRILPPFVVCCLAIRVAALSGLMTWHPMSLLGAVTFTKNTTLFGGDWFFGHFWSLSLEQQFYLLWPLILCRLANPQLLSIGLAALLLMAPALAVLSAGTLQALQNILPFVSYLAAGCLLALALRVRGWRLQQRYQQLRFRALSLAALAVVALTLTYLRHENHWPELTVPLDALACPVLALWLVADAVLGSGLLHRLLCSRPLVSLGAISYSLYLWQQLFFGPPEVYDRPWLWTSWPMNIVAALTCATLSYWLIERPASRIRILGHARRHRQVADSSP